MAMLVYQRVSPHISPHISTTLTGDGPIAPGALVEKHESLEMAFGALDSAAEGALTRESLAMGIEAQRGETILFATLFYGSIYIYIWVYIYIYMYIYIWEVILWGNKR